MALDPPHQTWVLDDGDRREVAELAARLGARYTARADRDHAKAGNLNHAPSVVDTDLSLTGAQLELEPAVAPAVGSIGRIDVRIGADDALFVAEVRSVRPTGDRATVGSPSPRVNWTNRCGSRWGCSTPVRQDLSPTSGWHPVGPTRRRLRS